MTQLTTERLDVTHQTNMENMRRPGMGAYRVGNRWKSIIRIKGRSKHLGYFDTPQEDTAAYLKAKRVHHDGCTL